MKYTPWVFTPNGWKSFELMERKKGLSLKITPGEFTVDVDDGTLYLVTHQGQPISASTFYVDGMISYAWKVGT